MPTAKSRSHISERIDTVNVRAATRAISPSRRQRYRQYGRARFLMVSTTCECGTGDEERRAKPLRPDGEAVGVTARAQVSTLAREREQVRVRAVVAADVREAVFEDSAAEERVVGLRDHGAPRAVRAGEAVVVDGPQPAGWFARVPEGWCAGHGARIRPCAARATACDGFGRGLALTMWRCG